MVLKHAYVKSELRKVGSSESSRKQFSKKIFLSHAAPEDNEFTRWLAGKLSLSEYSIFPGSRALRGNRVWMRQRPVP